MNNQLLFVGINETGALTYQIEHTNTAYRIQPIHNTFKPRLYICRNFNIAGEAPKWKPTVNVPVFSILKEKATRDLHIMQSI